MSDYILQVKEGKEWNYVTPTVVYSLKKVGLFYLHSYKRNFPKHKFRLLKIKGTVIKTV